NLGSGDKYSSSLPTGSVTLDGKGYAYLKMGKYNWIIIGYNSSSTTVNVNYTFDTAVAFSTYLANPSAYNSFAGSLETSTDAGSLISNAASNGIVWANWALSVALNYSSAVNAAAKGLTELSSGEVLVLCQGSAGRSAFGSNNVYSSSTLLTAMRNLYYPSIGKNGAEFSTAEADLIVPKTLTTAGSSPLTEYLFPLGSTQNTGDSFAVETYLDTNRRIIDDFWLLRSCYPANSNYVYYVNTTGSTKNINKIDGGNGVYVLYADCYVRPAMVIKI
ncbi:MAG: hypothetical protein IJ959_03745, partial [Clostridia bacterium]|nr:hypothetical protein [Clostridia bacterium]